MDSFWIPLDDEGARRLIAQGSKGGPMPNFELELVPDCLEICFDASPQNRRLSFNPRPDFEYAEGNLIELLFPSHFEHHRSWIVRPSRPELETDPKHLSMREHGCDLLFWPHLIGL